MRTKATVRELARTQAGWRLTVGPAIAPERIDADAVILALPARPASRLIGQLEGGSAAAALAEIEYASMAIVTLAYPAAAFPVRHRQRLPRARCRRPGGQGRDIQHRQVAASGAATLHVVRCSIGRIGEEAVLQRDDAELAALAAADLAAATGVTGDPVATPRHQVGRRAAAVHRRPPGPGRTGSGPRSPAQPGLAVCGAAYDGIGIPACIASARPPIRSRLPRSGPRPERGACGRIAARQRDIEAHDAGQTRRGRSRHEISISSFVTPCGRFSGSPTAGRWTWPAGRRWRPRSPSCASRRQART